MGLRLWLKNWLEYEPGEGCVACIFYRSEIDRMHRYNQQLLDALTRKNEPPPAEQPYETQVELKPTFTPWKVRRQILEAEDAKRAQIMRADKVVPLTEDDLEKEIEAMKNAK